MSGSAAADLIRYLLEHRLMLTTAESCTAGEIIAELSRVERSGAALECGYVVYSETAKRRILKVNRETIATFNLTSEQVAHEMAVGALRDSEAGVAIATTGIAGSQQKQGIPPGTICIAWGFRKPDGDVHVYTATQHFDGDRQTVQRQASQFAMEQLPRYHRMLLCITGEIH